MEDKTAHVTSRGDVNVPCRNYEQTCDSQSW